MDTDKIEWYRATLDAIEEKGFRCDTCENFTEGVCWLAGKIVCENDFCANWGEREAAE